ncbi:unnamed protein product [Adineta steineri]|uniref:Uncharacterized protein n=1 Tax=Adineta steineri TaxID=433720 RepID=A0A813YQP6_9BILA|nr:unnamed protein product [Adineta steineri]CAF0983135.1 unnamed protein product [Adineta steineri]
MAATSDEIVSVPSLISNNGNSSHTNGNNGLTASVDPIATFAWGNYLKTTNSHAAPVSYFHHAPLHNMWAQLTPGMKIEVINTDCGSNPSEIKEKVFWFAFIVRVEGYLALLRYEGCEDDSSMDFWYNLCNKDVHCVGWCGQNGVKLAPPRTIEHRQTDWKTFLINKLVGSKTLPDNFRQKIQLSLRCSFKRNMIVEVIDKYRVSNMRVGKITEVIGGRLKINYENTSGEHFWVHHTSELIHPVGWSHMIGHELEATDEYKTEAAKMVEMQTYPSNVATVDLFHHVQIPASDDEQFKEGQKLEAVDPLEMSRICPATVGKVLKDGYFMLSIDGSNVEDGSDWFCYHLSSRLIFPINFCKLNNIPLSPPIGYHGDFQWNKYLLETNSVYAPQDLFQIIKKKTINPFSVGMKIEAVDMMAPHLVCVATIAEVADSLIRIRFDGWGEDFEQWIDCQSPNIYPIGWCELVGYKLEPPKQPEQENSESVKTRTKKSTNRKSNKRKRLT